MTTGTIIGTRIEFHDALRAALTEVAEAGCRELLLCDEDFAEWPLGERAIVELFTRWAGAQRRLVVLARSFDVIARRHARWVEWRTQWAHVVECRALEEGESGVLPTLLLAPGHVCVRLFDPERYRGNVSHEPLELVRERESFDALSQRSLTAFPPTTLGL